MRYLLWLLLAVIGLVRADAPTAEPYELTGAHAQQISLVETLQNPSETPPAPAADWLPTELPDIWTRNRPGFGGTVWYRFTVDVPIEPDVLWALWLPKLAMNAELWINNELVRSNGSMDDRHLSRYWNTPVLFHIPQHVWRSGSNQIHLRIKARIEHGGGLAPMWLGPADELQSRHERCLWRQNTLVSACNVFVVSLGLFFLVVWLRHRARAHYGYFSLGAILMGLGNSNMAVNHAPLPDEQWELLMQALMVWGPLMLGLFGLHFAGRVHRHLDRSLLLYASLATMLLVWAGDRWRTETISALIGPVLILNGFALHALLQYVRQQPRRDHVLVGLAAIGTMTIGVHDWLIRAGILPFDMPYAMPYMTPLLLSTLCWLVAGEYAQSQQRLARMNQELAERVRQREAELQASFEQLAHVEREHAATAERSRILRDMHDGVGAHITTAMRQLESGYAEPELVAQTLRDSLDQLKLSIDAMNLPPGDVNALLASLRYRLQRRIEAAGIELQWQVDLLPVWAGGQQVNAMRHLQFIVFEALSNALQHSGATELLISAAADTNETIHIALQDNGCGMGNAGRHDGSALHTLHERAALLGARLGIEPAQPGTRVVVELPQPQNLRSQDG
jgi:signal transduction histidine kinase